MSLSLKGIDGEMSVGEMSVDEVSVEDRSQCRILTEKRESKAIVPNSVSKTVVTLIP